MSEAGGADWLPGDPSPAERVERVIRVDQAGEYGAVRIYAGQLAVLRRRRADTVAAVQAMAEAERRHLDAFDKLIAARRVRPTLLQPLWHLAGFALGAGTALLGERAAMACTVAVEEVIDAHYAGQVAALGEDEAELRDTVERFRLDEVAHRDEAMAAGAALAPGYPVLATLVKRAARLAIWLSERV